MRPALKPGDVILVDTWRYDNKTPAPGDIILFTRNKQDKRVFIKRVHQAPKALKATSDQIYVLGDNRAYSTDSRQFGLIDKKQIMGRATFIFLDPNGFQFKGLN